MILATAADGTVRDLSSAPADADAVYLADTMHLRPVVDRFTLAGTLDYIAQVRGSLDSYTDPVTRAYFAGELADAYREAAAIRRALAAAAAAAEDADDE